MAPARRRKEGEAKDPDSPRSPPGGGGGGGEERKKPKGDFWLRASTSTLMIVAFLGIIYVGQVPAVFFVAAVQVAMFREIVRIGTLYRKERKISGFGFLPWYFMSVTLGYGYLAALRVPLIKTFPALEGVLKHYTFIFFFLYVAGFIGFVTTLRPRLYTAQFTQFAWTHMAIFFIILQGAAMVFNMFEGMIWFLLPASLIIANDTFAYLCGRSFGRHSLIQLSPKKTWEGFIGAAVLTVLWGLYFSWQLAGWELMVCPRETLWSFKRCEPSVTFRPREYQIPTLLRTSLDKLNLWESETITLYPIQLHSLAFAAFASLVAPFGGFFASGLKRAFNLKDFGDLIPGHGGITDRMDCQILMATFAFVYLTNFHKPSGGLCSSLALLSYCARRLPMKDQVRLYNDLAAELTRAGVPILANGTAVPMP